jgi:CheY-like chemotaxis protein
MSNTVVAIANTNDDIIELLRLACERQGWTTATIHLPDVKAGRSDFAAFLKLHDPAAIIFDIAPPYDANWAFVETLRVLPDMRGRGVVVTTTHKRHLEGLLGKSTGALEIIGKPNDIQEVIDAVRRALAAR